MPQPGQEPDDEQISVKRQLAAAVSPQGNIKIFPKPGPERDMPAPPKFSYALGNIGVTEILREFESEHFQDEQGSTGEHYRTLWLAQADKKLAPVLEIKTILFPRKSGFYQLQVVRKEKGGREEDVLVVDHLLKQEKKENNLELLHANPPVSPGDREGSEGSVTRKINYIGNDYVSVEETLKQAPVYRGSMLKIGSWHSKPMLFKEG